MNPNDSKCSECEIIGQSNCSEHGTPNDSSDAAATKQESEVKTCAPTNATATQLEEGSKSSPGRQSESASNAAAGTSDPSSDAAAQDKDSTGFFSQNQRSWPEDARDEDNGSYENVCCSCRKLFIGNKDRVMCKACFLANPDVAAALSAERAKSEQAFALVDEYESELHAKDKENTQLQATVARLEAQSVVIPEGLSSHTAQLVIRFAGAMAEKLYVAEQKGRSGWEHPEWVEECQEAILEHLEKGDPRDVANFCAFLWYHGEQTSLCGYISELEAEIARLEGELAEAKQKCALYRQHSEAQDKLLSQFQDGGAEAMENAREDEIEKLRADLEAAKRERDEALELVSRSCFDEWSLQTDRDALAFQVERLREALEKVASLINESTGVAGLHLNGEVAPWCDLMTGGKYEGWLCGVFESLQLDAPTALRERDLRVAEETWRESYFRFVSKVEEWAKSSFDFHRKNPDPWPLAILKLTPAQLCEAWLRATEGRDK